ncbi:peptidase [Elizabethkingia meningoseptica]|uniref:Peptidase n=1 Tax=Elizabethkingia meningoseptica TaxID=238 RepID=A0A1V3U253_ELIME|nr:MULTISPECIES: GDSL-type esterase/lipase family protein [Elizabethkingia]AQX14011.1 peptidase [Elizabethkingia meningoseptica]MBG0515830.1 SGNH/GDSL hydrolase family protein [Elizabethkingia meningoseptica]MDE5433803.1 SGNH/GDSL hydrolase family protein [Elizabethkingia meningoseptica]MDE5450731.1 SGNH/GDSL hydrolase family protein [Elizabethkingia meningoseptica]MDE5470078.1 SGNH/GDSL hydrolase family protein [Elizabethkingia meningoseptica]
MINCLFFGDSITYGEYDGVSGGWTDILKRHFHFRFYNENIQELNVFNLGIGGETTDGLLKRFYTEAHARTSPDENLIFFAYGANDVAFKNGQQMVNQETFLVNLTEVIEQAKKITSKLYIISILPVASAIDGITVPSGKQRSNQMIIQYNTLLQQLSVQHEATYIDLCSLFFENKDTYLSRDGVHPNDKGYQFIAEQIKPIIEVVL